MNHTSFHSKALINGTFNTHTFETNKAAHLLIFFKFKRLSPLVLRRGWCNMKGNEAKNHRSNDHFKHIMQGIYGHVTFPIK